MLYNRCKTLIEVNSFIKYSKKKQRFDKTKILNIMEKLKEEADD